MDDRDDTTSSVVKSSEHATLTISIEGPYFPLTKFRKALDSFIDLLTEVDKETSESGGLTIEWAISSIESGGIHITAVGNPVDEQMHKSRPMQVIRTLTQGLDQLEEALVIPVGFSLAALQHTRALGKIINAHDFAEIRFASNGWHNNITPRLAENVDEITQQSQTFYGSIEGTLVSVNLAGKQVLCIRSSIEDQPIRCYFKDEILEIVEHALGRRVYVFGLIHQHLHGSKISIRMDDIEDFRILPLEEEMPSSSEILARLRHG